MSDDKKTFDTVHRFLDTLFGGSVHAKRILSLAGATAGAIVSSSLAVALIGQGLALARGLLPKHAIKQVDRMLSNDRDRCRRSVRPLGTLCTWQAAWGHGRDGLDRFR